MAVPGFIFGGNTGINSPEELARARAYAEALLGPQRPAQNVGEGLAVLGQAIRGRREMNSVNQASTAGQASAQSAIARALGGAGSFPPAPASGGSPVAPVASGAPVAQSPGGGAIRAKLIERGLPEHVADAFVMNFQDESGLNPGINEQNPTVPGSRGGFGLYQLTGPRRREYEKFAADRGVAPSDTDAQLDFLMKEGQGSEKAAFDAILAAPDTGSAAAAIVNKFLRPAESHRASRVARYLRAGPPQVASNDPTSGIAQALAGTPQPAPAQQAITAALNGPPQAGLVAGTPAAVTPAGQRVVQQMVNPQSMTGGAPMPMQQAQAASQPAPQAAPDNLPVMAGGSADAIPKGQLPSMQQLMEASQNPWLNEQQRGIVNMLMKQQLDQADPNNALDAEYKRAQIDALRTPKETSKPAGIQEYEYAKQQGFPGTLQDWEASKRGGMSLQTNADGTVTFMQGANMKPMTEGQSKDTTFATRAAGALPLIDQFGDALTSLPETMGGQVPVVGNFAKSKEFQQAEQAGKEFLQAILRKDTGAAITAEETSEYGSVYLPRPGDSPELLAQKKASRTRALEALKAGMTPQALLAQEKALAASGGAAPAPEAPKKRLKFNPATGELE